MLSRKLAFGALYIILQGSLSGGKEEGKGWVQKRPTVGRRCDLLWVAIKTYCSFFRRPTVGRFLPLLEIGTFTRGKGRCLRRRETP